MTKSPIGPLVLIDGHNMFIRNYVRSPYMDGNGQRAGGTTGMVQSVRKVINDYRPSNVLVVWDGEGGSQRRRSIYSEYKAGRKVRLNEEYDFGETPEERMENMRKQRNDSSELLTLLGVPQVRADAVEADDLIAYIAGKMDHPNGCIIVSTDQDYLQLITSEVKVYSPVKKIMYDRERFISDFGVLPENFRLVKALAGDGSDNIEGVKGFGFKTISKSFPFLSEKRTTADEVLAAAEGLAGVLGKRLVEEKNRFLENLTLVDLSEPMLSATAARQARDALARDLGCKDVEFRMRVVRDGISFQGNDFTGVFRDFVMRRRKLLAAQEQADVDYVREQIFSAIKIPEELKGFTDEQKAELAIEEDYFLPKRDGDGGNTGE